jgi:[acyl-carrier-protein] S-malonyltransferase
LRTEGIARVAVAVMFPGQGTQRAGLGQGWRHTPAWSVVERAETALDRSLSGLLLDPDASLERTEDAQLAVLVTSLMAWEAAAGRLSGPVAFAGHSLGQVTALVAAGALSFDDGLRLAARRAGHTQRTAERSPGRMAALVGASLDQAEQACLAAPGSCWVANDNGPGQVVLAGAPAALESALERARSLGTRRIVPLEVQGAFHTPLMQDAAAAFAEDLRTVPFSSTAVPVVSNGDARAYTDGAGWRGRLVEHLVQRVRWRQSVETLVSLGATELVEVGPGTTLGGLAKRIVPGVTVSSTDSTSLEVPA